MALFGWCLVGGKHKDCWHTVGGDHPNYPVITCDHECHANQEDDQ